MATKAIKTRAKGRNRRRTKRLSLPASRVRVRDAILRLLEGGRQRTRHQLLEEGRFSAASLDLHLKQLRADGVVSATHKRPLLFSLVRGRRSGTGMSTAIPPDLGRDLDAISVRLAKTTRLTEKRETLERLAETLPPRVASVLRDILRDYECLARSA